MAERRMFAKTIIDSDPFLDMPLSTQALYFHLCMRADDEGFINSTKKIMRMIGCSDDEMRLLIAKRFVIPFESGIVVIKHWHIHNMIRADRLRATVHTGEKSLLEFKENKAYTERTDYLPANCQPNDNQMTAQYSIGEYSIDQDRVEEAIADKPLKPSKKKKPVKHQYGIYKKVLLSDDELNKLKEGYPDYLQRIDRLDEYIEMKGAKYTSHLATIRAWARKDQNTKPIENINNTVNKVYESDANGWG